MFFFSCNSYIAQAENASSSEECICHVYNGDVNREDKLIQGYSLRDAENDAKTWLLVCVPSDDILANKSREARPFILSKTQNYLCANQSAKESSV